MSDSISDVRTSFPNNLLLNTDATSQSQLETHISQLTNINNFINNFNSLLVTFQNSYNFHVDDIMKNLRIHDTLSKSFLHLVYVALWYHSKDTNLNFNKSQFNEIKNFRKNLWNLNKNSINPINNLDDISNVSFNYNLFPNDTKESNIKTRLITNNVFKIYNHIKHIESSNINSDSKLLISNIYKHNFMSELLLRSLLDTNYNTNGGDSTIVNYLGNNSSQLGIGNLHNNVSSTLDSRNDCTNNKPNSFIMNKFKYLMKKIHSNLLENDKLYNKLNKNVNILNIDKISERISIRNNTINELNVKKNDYEYINRTLTEKNVYSSKNNYQNKIKFYLLLLLIIIFIAYNFYVVFSNKDDRIINIINILIIIILLITKFYYLLK